MIVEANHPIVEDGRNPMSFWEGEGMTPLNENDLKNSLEWVGLQLSATQFAQYQGVAERLFAEGHTATQSILGTLNNEKQVAEPALSGRSARHPSPADDPLNAIAHWCSGIVTGAEGPLSGLRIAIKNSIAVAGVPLTAGSDMLADFTPSDDAEVVRRILHAGGEVVATTNMDYLALSGGGDTSAQGPIRNPFAQDRSAGGSSGGSAACLSYASVDLSVGCDQGGSIRAPAAWCGVLGLKPTFGLLPYTGILGLDPTFDHCGPMARTVDGLARLLQVMAGPDENDPRQCRTQSPPDYVAMVHSAEGKLRGLRIGLVDEAMSSDSGTDPAVASVIDDVAGKLSSMGARVARVSVPGHDLAGSISNNVLLEGASASFQAGGIPPGFLGSYWEQAASALARGLSSEQSRPSLQVQMALGFGAYLTHVYRGAAYIAGKRALAMSVAPTIVPSPVSTCCSFRPCRGRRTNTAATSVPRTGSTAAGQC